MPVGPAKRAEILAKRQRTCAICGVDFVAKRTGAGSYCSKECNQERNRRWQQANSERARQGWKKVCPTCGKEHMGVNAHSQGYCSRECYQVVLNAAHIGRKQGEEEKARRTKAVRAFYAANPDAEKKRIENARAATQTDEYRAKALERYEAMLKDGRGICSDEVRAFTASRAKWIMLKVREEMEADTGFIELWKVTRERIMREMPYDGPGDWADHNAYMRKVGKKMTADPALRALQDGFCREAIPRWSKAFDEQVGRN